MSKCNFALFIFWKSNFASSAFLQNLQFKHDKDNLKSVCSYHVMYAFQSESTLYSCLNFKELLAQNRRNIWRLDDCNETPTQNHLLGKQTLNHLAKLSKWLSWVVSNYLYGAFDCMPLPYHLRISEQIYTLYLPECRGTPCSDQARYLKFKWLQRDTNLQPLSS